MIEKAVIYNTIDRTGICPEEVYNKKKLPIGVSVAVDINRTQLRELFSLYDLDHAENTNKFGEMLLEYLHTEFLKDVDNDKVIPFRENMIETTIPKKYYLDAGIEEDLGGRPSDTGEHKRPICSSDFTR